MKHKRWLLVLMMLALPLLPACAAAIPNTGDAGGGQPAKMPDDYLTLLDELRGTGVEVVDRGQMGQALFDVAAQLITVDGDDVQIFIFESQPAREIAQKVIASNARSHNPEFGDRPYFWASGRMLALYKGENPKVLSSMSKTLGQPVIRPDLKNLPADLERKETG